MSAISVTALAGPSRHHAGAHRLGSWVREGDAHNHDPLGRAWPVGCGQCRRRHFISMTGMQPTFAERGPWGAQPAVGATKALLRLVVRQPELANSIADLAGIDTRGGGVRNIAGRAIEQLADSQHDYKDMPDADREAAETRLTDVLREAALRLKQPRERERYDLAVGCGAHDVEAYLREGAPRASSSRWGADPSDPCFETLLHLAAFNIYVWAVADPASRERATLALARASSQGIDSLSGSVRVAVTEMAEEISELKRLREEMMSPAHGGSHGFVVLYDPNDQLHTRQATWIEQVLIAAGAPVRRTAMRVNGFGVEGAAKARAHQTCLVPWREGLGSAPEDVVVVGFEGTLTEPDPSAIVVPRAVPAPALLAELSARLPHARLGGFGADQALVIDAHERLPRLRFVSEQAVSVAAAVGEQSFRNGPDTTTPLFVRRDLHASVVAAAAPGRLIVVKGEAGDGKTSLLWGIARGMTKAADRRDVYFVPAGHLVQVGHQAPLVSADELTAAVRQHGIQGDIPMVLIDTADLLVNDTRSLMTLRTVLEELRVAGGCVIVTSRPHEAQRIATDSTHLFGLGRYATTAATGQTSEFARAVAGHAITYCHTPGDATALSEQVTQAVMRDNSLGEVARKPLFLRMLFELYSPGVIPADIEPTVLFEQFWQNRVVEDRRRWDDGAGVTGGDLSRTTKRLAMEMLRVGRPEVDVRDIPVRPEGRNSFAQDVSWLVSRGVGRRPAVGLFAFFHQAFFEYAAALALLDAADGLDIAVQRVASHPDDLFLAAVVEQAWMSAWRRPETRDTAERLAVDTLRDNTVPDVLMRVATRTVAGNRVSPRGQAAIDDLLSHADVSLVKEYLRRRPRPGRSWEDAESHWVRILRNRGPKFWAAGMERLGMAFGADPQLTMTGLTEALSGGTTTFPSAGDLEIPDVRTFIRLVGAEYPDRVLQWLEAVRARAGTLTAKQQAGAISVLQHLPERAAERSAELADQWLGHVSGISAGDYAELHHRWIGSVDADRRDALVERAKQCLDVISAGGAAEARVAAAYVRGLCLALDEWDDSDRDFELLELLLQQTSPRIHEQVHDGWLAPMANRSDTVRERLAQVLSGLPASKASPENDGARWADTVRRLLSHRLLRAEARAVILQHLGRLSPGLAVSDSWLDPARLLPILIWGAAANVDSAWQALDYLRVAYGDAARRHQCRELVGLALRTEPLTRDEPRMVDVLRILADMDRLLPVESYLKFNPTSRWPQETVQAVEASVWRTLMHGDPAEKAVAVRVLETATSNGQLKRPDVDELLRLLEQERDEAHASTLASVVMQGVILGDYPREPLLNWLRARVPAQDSERGPEAYREHLYRQSLVTVAALAPGVLTVDELVELALRPPVQADSVQCLTGVLTPGADGELRWPVTDRVRLVLLVGKRLAGPDVTNRARKDTAGRWRQPLSHLLSGLDATLTLTVLHELPTVEERLAEVIAGRVTAYDTPESRDAMRAVETDERVTAETRRQLTFAQRRSLASSPGWWTVDGDLQRGAG